MVCVGSFSFGSEFFRVWSGCLLPLLFSKKLISFLRLSLSLTFFDNDHQKIQKSNENQKNFLTRVRRVKRENTLKLQPKAKHKTPHKPTNNEKNHHNTYH